MAAGPPAEPDGARAALHDLSAQHGIISIRVAALEKSGRQPFSHRDQASTHFLIVIH